MKKILLSILIFFAVAIAAAAIFLAYALQSYEGTEKVRLNIPSGTSTEAFADTLGARLGSYGRAVDRLWRWQGGEVMPGSYVVEPGMSALTLSRRLKQGRQTPVRLTFNSLRTLSDLARVADGALELSAEEFIAACDSVLPPRGYRKPEFVAAFLPDTYEFYWTAPATTVVSRMADVRDRFWNDNRRAKAAELGLRPVQVATLASIVEEETNNRAEQPTVARLYLNRLDRKMNLQADPTVKFATGDPTLRRITAKHLAIESPYNTYKHPGLPPGPIRIADRRTIDAVLDAPVHPYLYMCAKEDFSGTHRFAKTFEEHKVNARRYQAELNRRGIN